MPLPGKPVNPEIILADTSALLQIFLADTIPILKHLKSEYSTQVAVVEAVESEILHLTTRSPKFIHLGPAAKKAFSSGVIEVLNLERMVRRYGNLGGPLLQKANEKGDELRNFADRGEAYTHAAAEVLSLAATVPTLTNDMTAVNDLIAAGKVVPRPLLRSFDVFAFGFQIGILPAEECNKARKALHRAGDDLHPAFSNCSFVDGLPSFFARLLDGDCEPVGARTQQERYDDRLWLSRPKKA